MPNNYDKLLNLLRELFQLDQAKELDFGIYRIIAQREKEISDFMEKDLLPQVKEILGETAIGDNAAIQAELDKAVQQAKELGVDPKGLPKVKELKAKLGEGGDLAALENEVFSHLYNFFRRYYHQGDFISQRRYKEGVYAIPYEGEEVKLHWANADQYYIKTTENFRDFTFKLPSKKRVHFKLVEASTEQDNKKAQEGKDRRFKLYEEEPLVLENEELVIRFIYEVDKTAQKKLTEAAVEAILTAAEADFKPWGRELSTKAPTEKNKNRTILEKQLTQYTAENSFDYFIHKDLKGFLSREMDFYIKNEIMHLDDIVNESVPKVESYLSKVKAFRRIATQIITFLSQLEDFQKKLWLKKKFVVETNWCITLDHVLAIKDEKTRTKLLEEIAANNAQREDWVRLFAINEIKASKSGTSKKVSKKKARATGGLFDGKETKRNADGGGSDEPTVAYSSPLTVEFLAENEHLPLDTRFFSESFREGLLHSFHELDYSCNGVLVHSENFQATQLLQARFADVVDCIYIDPPYNSDASPILYKNGYKQASWLSLMSDRLTSGRSLLKQDTGVIGVAIDDVQQRELNFLMSSVFSDNLLGIICVRSNPSGRPMQTGYSVSHEYVIFAGVGQSAKIGRMLANEEQKARFKQQDSVGAFEWRNLRREGSNSDRRSRPFLYYPIFITDDTFRVPDMVWNEGTREWELREQPKDTETVIYPNNDRGVEKTWRWGHETVVQKADELAVRKNQSGENYIYYKRRPHDEGVACVSSWFDAKYSATEHGTAVIKNMFGANLFSFPKSVYAVTDSIYIGGASRNNALVMDFFGGSGTTAHAVVNLNRDDNGSRKFILVEMGEHFESILKPRVLKCAYANAWADGKPKSRTAGTSMVIKYVRLESYEDSLNNLQLARTPAQTKAFEFGDKKVKREYMLSYMLDVESRGSLLNLEFFDEPNEYVLNIQQGDEAVPTKVDLPETFNYLLGLRVKHVDVIRGVRVIEGMNPAGERALVLWRNAKKMDSDKLDDWFIKQGYNTKDMEYDLIYVNGDNNLENLRKDEHTWKVRLIEQEFHRLMFDVEDV